MSETEKPSLPHGWRRPRTGRAIATAMTAVLSFCAACAEEQDIGKETDVRPAQKIDVPREPVVQIGHPNRLGHIVFSPDGKQFLTTTADSYGSRRGGAIILWDATTGDKLREFDVGPGEKPEFCLEGRAFLIAGKIWDLGTGRRRQPAFQREDEAVDGALSADGRRLVVHNGVDKVWVVDLETGRELASFSRADAKPAPDPPPEKAEGEDTEREDAEGQREEEAEVEWDPGEWIVKDAGFTTDNTPIALLENHRTYRLGVWNAATAEKRTEFDVGLHDRARLSPCSKYVVTRNWGDTGSAIETTFVVDAQTGEQVCFVNEWMYAPDSVQFTDDDRFCVTGTTQRRATLWDLENRLAVRTFEGHVEPIYDFRFVDGGNALETRSPDAALRWDWRTGALLQEFRNPSDTDPEKTYSSSPRKAVVVPSPDGTTFISGVQLYETATGRLLDQFAVPRLNQTRVPPHVYHARRATYTPDGKMVILDLATAYHDCGQSVLYDVASGEFVRQIAFSPLLWHGLTWSPDGRRALTFPSHLHRLWDVERGRPLQTIGRVAPRTWYPAPQIAFSANGKFVYIYGRQFGAFFWDAETGLAIGHDPPGEAALNRRALLDGRKHGDYYLGRSTISADGRFVASWYRGLEDRKHKTFIWDIEKGSVSQTLDHGDALPVRPYFSPDGRHVAVLCTQEGQEIVMWDLLSGERLYSLRPPDETHTYGGASVWFLPDGKRVLVNTRQRELTLFEVADGSIVHRMIDPRPEPERGRRQLLRETLLISLDGRRVLADYSADAAIVWDLPTGEPIKIIERDMGGVVAPEYYSFSDDGGRLLCRHKPATLWDLETGEATVYGESQDVPELDGFVKPIRRSRFDYVVDRPATQEVLDRFKDRIPETARATEQTADGRRLIVHHQNGCMAVWDITSGEPIYHCYQFRNGSRWLTVTPDGKCDGNLEFVRYRPDSGPGRPPLGRDHGRPDG